jgi:subtilisin-like proprotein convertase family protein
MLRRRLLSLMLALIALSATLAVAAPIKVSDQASALAVTAEKGTGLSFHVQVGELEATDIATKSGVFTRLAIPGFHTSMIEGAPELPQMNRLVAVPAGATARVSVRNVVTTRVKLADYGITRPIFPAQPSVSKSADLDNLPFVQDMAAYMQKVVSREPATILPQGRLRAMDFARLEIAPVTWYPTENEIEVVTSMDVDVAFDNVDKSYATDLIARTYSPFFESLYAGMAGEKAFHDAYPDRVGDVVTMVIVTPPAFASQMADFVAWKTQRGFRVIMAVTGTPAVGTTTTSIEAYLNGLYNNATPELPAPSFVLFVGDVAEMPTFQEGGDATDRPYCAVDADLIPDMYYGRFSATNPTQLQAQLDKTMMYDQYTMPDPSYLNRVTMMAGVDGTYAPTHGNGQILYGTNNYFNAAHGITSNTWLYPASNGAVEAAVIQTVNDGVALINYTAHGSETSWADPTMTQANINAMTNVGKPTLAIGNCCLTSTYDYAECFGETFLRAANKGAVGYIGASNSTYWDEDYWWGVGFHASSQIDGSGYPILATGIGAYDGMFHESGEAAHLWYVTNDALVFSGNLAVSESGSSRTTYYWNIYNLLGDPSLSTYLVPTANSVTHPATVFVGQTSISVGAATGSYVGLTQNGVLMGCGTVNAKGTLDVTYFGELTPGVPMKLVVTAQNKVPYITDINVIVPATVTINPTVIDVNVPTAITVTVMNAEGTLPLPGISVWAEGLDYATTPVLTDAAGVAVVNVNAAYGPTLDIVGQDMAETYRLFTEPVTVNAATLTAPDLTVTTGIGLSDAFALNLPGTLHASVTEPGATLYARLPNGTLLETTAADLALTPTGLGVVTGTIAVSGYNVYSENFNIIEAYGQLTGTVTSAGSPMVGVTVRLLDETLNEVFAVVSGAGGAWSAPEDILVDDYTVVVDHFGYLHFEAALFINYGANTYDVVLAAAPSGVFSGTIFDSVTNEPLQGTVRVYRSDNGSLYTETTSGVDGSFVTSALPYFTYNIQARAWHHKPVTMPVTIEEPETIKGFLLDPTAGDLLLIDDGAKSADKAAKFGGKLDDELLAAGYTAPVAKSAAQMLLDLEEMGYSVTSVTAAAADPATFDDYDLVILACGDNTATLANTALKAGLVSFAQTGGHILLEGGELGYDQYGDTAFATTVMHTTDWNADSAGTITVNDAAAYILNNPNAAAVPLGLTYAGYGDSDAMAPLADAARPLAWSTYASDASVITYDPNPAPEGGQIVFFCFNYLAAAAGRYQLLENAILWLTTPEIGSCTVTGHALLAGQSNHAGIVISASPNGGTTTTAADGSYTLSGLFAGAYTIHAAKAGYASADVVVTLTSGETRTGVDFAMNSTTQLDQCVSPALAIADNTTVNSTMDVLTAGVIGSIKVYTNITHTYRGDLVVTLVSPAGTSVVLHNRTGSGTDNLTGWFPGDFTPAGNLSSLLGQNMQGTWRLTVADQAGGDTGTLNQWCLQIVYAPPYVAGVDDETVPSVLALAGNYPNPFNPVTNIKFDLPVRGHVTLQIFDVAGRLVRTLVDETMEAATHTAVWNGTDDAGRLVSSGAYYCRVSSGGAMATSKLLLLK